MMFSCIKSKREKLLLSIKPTSAESERGFFYWLKLLTPLRRRLYFNRDIENLVFLKTLTVSYSHKISSHHETSDL